MEPQEVAKSTAQRNLSRERASIAEAYAFREDVWEQLVERESERPPYCLYSPQLPFRRTLVHTLRQTTTKLGLSLTTFHLAISQLDLFMNEYIIRGDLLMTFAVACFSIAIKVEEAHRRRDPAVAEALATLVGVGAESESMRHLEWMLCEHMGWKFTVPTAATFAYVLAQFVVTDEDVMECPPMQVQAMQETGAKMLDIYLELAPYDEELKIVDNVRIGCACVAAARKEIGLPEWSDTLIMATDRELESFEAVVERLTFMMFIMKMKIKQELEEMFFPSLPSNSNETSTPRTLIEVSRATILHQTSPINQTPEVTYVSSVMTRSVMTPYVLPRDSTAPAITPVRTPVGNPPIRTPPTTAPPEIMTHHLSTPTTFTFSLPEKNPFETPTEETPPVLTPQGTTGPPMAPPPLKKARSFIYPPMSTPSFSEPWQAYPSTSPPMMTPHVTLPHVTAPHLYPPSTVAPSTSNPRIDPLAAPFLLEDVDIDIDYFQANRYHSGTTNSTPTNSTAFRRGVYGSSEEQQNERPCRSPQPGPSNAPDWYYL